MKNETNFRLPIALTSVALALVMGNLMLNPDALAKDTSDDRPSKASPPKVILNETPVDRGGRLVTSFAPVVKKVAPSVVKVFTTTKPKRSPYEGSPFMEDPMFRRFFGAPFGSPGEGRGQSQHGLGSGVIVTKDGYILTNNHVVEGADDVKVAISPDDKQFSAKIVGRDPKTDIALLKVEAGDLPAAELANSDQIEVGDVVLAIGNPFGIGQTVTSGIISATGRANFGLDYEDFIQTDAAINPGNSGGALIDAQGRLIGINTLILSRSGGNQGIGFAVPVNIARTVMESLVRDGRMVRGYLGLSIQDLNQALAKKFDLDTASGALVGDVQPKSPASKAGVKSGDVILEFNDKPVKDAKHLRLQAAATAPGTEVSLRVLRDGEKKKLSVVLKELPEDGVASKGHGRSSDEPDLLDGVTVEDLDSRKRRELGVPSDVKGALVAAVEEDSPSHEAGLRKNDVVREINRQQITGADEAVELSEKFKSEKSVLLRVWRGGSNRYVVVEDPKKG